MIRSSVCFLLLLVRSLTAAPAEDLIESLPLFGKTPTPHYSGFLDATDGCDTDVNGYCHIHYWLALADGDWENKPLVLWSNGGPGSSSVLGFLQELGPLLINATGGLMENPYAWTTVANVFVFESPVGVGFSYCQTQVEGGLCQNTDKYTASASRAAVVDFFRKFPEFLESDFFITGESYAGVYIPTLAYEILQYNAKHTPAIPLKGLAVGDPCTDDDAQDITMDSLWYGHKYGLVDDEIFDILWNHCDVRIPNILLRHDAKLTSITLRLQDSPECTLAWRKFMLSSSKALSQQWSDMFIDDYSLFDPVSFDEDNEMATYMNRVDVKEALHVAHAPIDQWPFPEAGFDYTKEYRACNWDDATDPDALSMIDFYRKIVPKLKMTWIYNGDTDPCVTYEGTRTAVKRIGFPELDGGGYRPWFYNHTATTVKVLKEKPILFGPDLLLQDAGMQFGGEVIDYEHGLSFLTVHGSGHMVPQFRPQAALQMIRRLVQYKGLSPLMPTNATLTAMSDEDFSDALDSWTESAKSFGAKDHSFVDTQ